MRNKPKQSRKILAPAVARAGVAPAVVSADGSNVEIYGTLNKRKLGRKFNGVREFIMSILTGSVFFLATANSPVHASTEAELLKILKDKGMLTQPEYEILIQKLEEERLEDRAEKRQTRQKAAITEAKREEEAKKEIKATYKDGITWESGDKSTSFSVNGRVQLDYRDFGSPDGAFTNTFDIRRARLSAKGKFLKYYSFVVEGDFGSTTVLTDGYFDIAWWKPATLRFGQFKTPISLEEQTSSRFIDFLERSFVNNFNLTPSRERGAMVHGEPVMGLTYGLSVTTGQGQNNNETSATADGVDVDGRVTANIAEFIGQKSAVYHVGGSFSRGDQPATLTPASQRTEARGVTFFVPSAFSGTGDVERTRYGIEGAFALGPVKLQGEYANANFDGTSAGSVGFDRDINAYYASVLWLVTGENYADSYKGGKFDRIRPKVSFAPGSGGFGAWEIGARYSKFDASDFRSTNPVGTGVLPAGFSNQAKAWTVGLKWIVNPNTRFLVNYIKTDFYQPFTSNGIVVNDEKAITLRAQIDF
ncbi:MAG: porin [Burkholderiales bacterium]